MSDIPTHPHPDCPMHCLIPDEGVKEVPPSRHRWSDILVCPFTDVCDRQFLVEQDFLEKNMSN